MSPSLVKKASKRFRGKKAASIRHSQRMRRLGKRVESARSRLPSLRYGKYVRSDGDGAEAFVVEMPVEAGSRVEIFAEHDRKLVVVIDEAGKLRRHVFLPDSADPMRAVSFIRDGLLIIETPL